MDPDEAPAPDGPTVEILIRYDPARDEEAALQLARRIFADLGESIGALTLLPRPGADFALWLEGAPVAPDERPTTARTIALARRLLTPSREPTDAHE